MTRVQHYPKSSEHLTKMRVGSSAPCSRSGLLIQVDWLKVTLRMVHDNWEPLLPNCSHIVEHCTCHSDVTRHVWCHPQTCESGLQLAEGHFNPGPRSSKSPVGLVLALHRGSRGRACSHKPCVKLSYRMSSWRDQNSLPIKRSIMDLWGSEPPFSSGGVASLSS